MATYTCQHYRTAELFLLALYCIIELVQCFVCIISIYHVRGLRKAKKASPMLLISQYMFFIIALLYSGSRIFISIVWCYKVELLYLSRVLLLASYSYHLWTLLFLLYSRLFDIFKTTCFEINACTNYYFVFMLVLFGLCPVLLFFLFSISTGLALVTGALVLILALCVAQHMAWLFVHKLRQMSQKTETKHTSEFFHLIRKYSILSLMCVMCSTVYALLAGISGIIGYGWLWGQILSVMSAFDVLVDTVCMALSFSKHDKYYKRVCTLCHYHCFTQKQNDMLMLQSVASVTADSGSMEKTQPTVTVSESTAN